MAVEFCLFGGVSADAGGRRLDLGPARQRCVLAVLLVEANTAVSADVLIDRAWPGSQPSRTRVSLQSYVSRLRGVLAVDPDTRIEWANGGYRLAVRESGVDLHRFRRLVTQARTADDDERAVELVEQALGLWRGEPFAGLDTPWLGGIRAALDTERLAVVLDHADLLLRHGRHRELLPTLAAEAEEHPLDERLAGQLMLALYRGSRQADALHHYQRTRARLADELGIDPGPALRSLYQRILTADPTLDGTQPAAAPLPVPRQLPPAPWLFTGRDTEIAALTERMDADSPHTMVISAIGGTGGIGKTWLALHWAHRNAHRFPDGQLYANLRGFDPSGTPAAPADVLRAFLAALGVDPVPVDEDARAGLYRSLLSDRRMLVVLDNAAGTSQVAPLLPGSNTCTVLITSRDRLAGIVMSYGALSLRLDVLSEEDSRTLLAAGVGARRMEAEHDAVADLLKYCAGLPLALSIVAGRALTSPGLPLAALADELRNTDTRLSHLAEDPVVNVRAVLSWSYQALDPDQATLFALLGSAPGPDVERRAVASLVDWTDRDIDAVLSVLERGSLLQQPKPGRYRMHDLVRLYAGERAGDLPDAERDAALRRLADFYTHTACVADRALFPTRPGVELPPPAPGAHPLNLSDDKDLALRWFDAEHANLLAIQDYATSRGWHRTMFLTAWALTTYHHWRGCLTEDVRAWERGLAGAQALGEPKLVAMAHRRLGYAYAWVDRHADALTHMERALDLAGQAGDRHGEAANHHGMSQVLARSGDDRRGFDHAMAAMRMFQELGQSGQEASAHTSAAWAAAKLGDYEWARSASESTLELHRKHGNAFGEADSHYVLGYVAQHTGRPADALDEYQEALVLLRDLGNKHEEADTLYRMGQVHAALGEPALARAYWQRALARYREHHRRAETERTERDIAELG